VEGRRWVTLHAKSLPARLQRACPATLWSGVAKATPIDRPPRPAAVATTRARSRAQRINRASSVLRLATLFSMATVRRDRVARSANPAVAPTKTAATAGSACAEGRAPAALACVRGELAALTTTANPATAALRTRWVVGAATLARRLRIRAPAIAIAGTISRASRRKTVTELARGSRSAVVRSWLHRELAWRPSCGAVTGCYSRSLLEHLQESRPVSFELGRPDAGNLQ
jgi:hypothetical protein